MKTRRGHDKFALCFAALTAVLVLLGSGQCLAKEWEVVNTPPPMPPALQRPGQGPSTDLAVMPVEAEHTARVNGVKRALRQSPGADVGVVTPDGDGGYVWIPAPSGDAVAGQADARELKLKVREMASQLIAGMDPALRGMVALPTSFVNQENFSQSSPLGRFMAEQLIYEFNQRGFPVREYRMASAITAKEGQGEFLLSRKVAPVSAKTGNAVFVVGTYFLDRQAVFVNARLVRGNGEVLRTAQIMLPGTPMTRRMLAGTGKILTKGSLPIQDYKTTTQPTNLTPFDLGEDIH